MLRPGPPPFLHPDARCESTDVGPGTRIWAFAHVMAGSRIGRDCNLGEGVFVETGAVIGDRVTVKNGCLIWKGVTLEDDVFVGPGVLFTNDLFPRSPRMPEAAGRYATESGWLVPTHVERGASLGAGAVLVAGVRLGAFAMVGAGSVVTRDVPAHALVLGNPARRRGWVCSCGQRLPESRVCGDCGRTLDGRGA